MIIMRQMLSVNHIVKGMLKLRISVITILFIGCVHNYEPVISQIIAEPNPVAIGGVVNLSCVVSDDDVSNMLKTERLKYKWDAAVGDITGANDSVATWQAPQDSGHFSITCIVEDMFNGLDISTVTIIVE